MRTWHVGVLPRVGAFLVVSALATISAETGRFVPIDEFVSRFNTCASRKLRPEKSP